LIGVAAMLIASKYEEIYAPEVSDLYVSLVECSRLGFIYVSFDCCLCYLFVCLFIYSFVRSFVCLCCCYVVCLFVCFFICLVPFLFDFFV
jgi:hypothetical protein